MARIAKLDPEKTEGDVKEMYAGVKLAFGRIPNIFQYMGNSPQLLKAFLSISGLLAKSTLSPRTQEKIALAIGKSNDCNYCLSAHSALLKGMGASPEDVEAAKNGGDADKKTDAILKFAKAISEKKGGVSDEELNAAKSAGISDQEISDVILAVTVNFLTNSFNRMNDTPVDF